MKKILQAPNHSKLQVKRIVIHRVDNSKLPPVRDFFERELGCQFSRADRHGEIFGACCFHLSKSGKSFSANVETGLWFCHGCGFGGDLFSFVMRRYGLSYLDAAKYLGTLEDGPPVQVPTVRVPYLTFDFDIACDCYSDSVRDEPHSYAAKIRRFYREAADRLIELGPDQAETKEAEVCWTRMSLALDELRELEGKL